MAISRNPADKRAFGRRPTQDHAIVRVAGRPPMRCVIRDISEGGALLDFGTEVWLPFQFKLIWEGTKREEDCEARHQNGGRVGVMFVTQKTENTAKGVISVNELAPWMSEGHPSRR
ncbi:MAG: PilZ domain-containing protein [Hyphomicrobium sp.]|nr:PilZ domain-containing protein [Hyphomicrobium sp.]